MPERPYDSVDQLRATYATWKDLAQAAYKKQFASKEKTPVSEGLPRTDQKTPKPSQRSR